MSVESKSGASYDFWIEELTKFIAQHEDLTCMDMDGVRRFPITVPCIIFDNLNYIYAEKNCAFIGMQDEGWTKLQQLFTLMGRFRARFYVCSASAARWGLGSGFDH
eukprot:14054582-Heterocapsa_arctica.AAC.1